MHNHSKLSPIYKKGDIKYYWRVHCEKMEKKGEKPVTYARFWDRLERGWVLKVAINTPNCRLGNRDTSIQPNAWRETVKLLLEIDDDVDTSKSLDELIQMNRIQMPKPKPTLWRRIKMWFLRKREK